MTAEPLDLGHGVHVRFAADQSGQRVGLWTSHPAPDGRECGGFVRFEGHGMPNGPTWEVHCLDPLDLTPSLLCTKCGHHGWIRAGRWVPV